jgi:hypothetical protein
VKINFITLHFIDCSPQLPPKSHPQQFVCQISNISRITMSVTGVLVHSLYLHSSPFDPIDPSRLLVLSAISNLEASASELDPRILGFSFEKILHCIPNKVPASPYQRAAMADCVLGQSFLRVRHAAFGW